VHREVRAMSKKRRKLPSGVVYDGPLAKRLRRSFEMSIHKQRISKLLILLAKYNIDHTDPEVWMKLALLLSIDHVPGFQIEPLKKKTGQKWRDGLGEQLVRDVETLCDRHKKMKATEAIRRLRASSPNWKKYTLGNLQARHDEAKGRRKKRNKALSDWIEYMRHPEQFELDRSSLKKKFGHLTISNLKNYFDDLQI
jgi:hypothetical protein